jgi:hypothetical protein
VEAGGVAYATITARGWVASRSSTYQLGVAATQTPAADPVGTTVPVAYSLAENSAPSTVAPV